jgi:hypothetical protein
MVARTIFRSCGRLASGIGGVYLEAVCKAMNDQDSLEDLFDS